MARGSSSSATFGSTPRSAPGTVGLTGHSQLDALIEEYRRGETPTTQNGVSIPVACLRDPEAALGNCSRSAHHFSEFLRLRGINAYTERFDEFKGPPSKNFGYDERTVSEDDWGRHYFTVVEYQDEAFIVDWTAAQFGYREWPLIQRRLDGRWQRA